MGHSEDRYWRKKDTKPSNSITNYLEVLVNDEEATLNELNRICGANHHLKSGNKILKKRLPIQANEVEGVAKQAEGADARLGPGKQYPILVQDQKFFYIS
jgi:hypothetical protein